MKTLIFDIETGPAPEEEIRSMMPDFDPNAVKMGNLKDPEKRAEKLKEAKENYYTDAYAKAALHAWSGQVLAIGYRMTDGDNTYDTVVLEGDEADIISDFIDLVANCRVNGGQIIGFNIKGFDLPFLARRAMKHGLLRADVLRPANNRYYFDCFVDIMEIWQCGSRMEFISMNRLATFMGCDQKIDNGVTGKSFWSFYEDEETRELALDYLRQDIEVTAQIAEKLLP